MNESNDGLRSIEFLLRRIADLLERSMPADAKAQLAAERAEQEREHKERVAARKSEEERNDPFRAFRTPRRRRDA